MCFVKKITEINKNRQFLVCSNLYVQIFETNFNIFKNLHFHEKKSYAYFHEKKNAFILRKYSNPKIVKNHENEEYQFYIPTTIG